MYLIHNSMYMFLNNFSVQCPWTSRGCCPDLNGQNWEGERVKHRPGLWIQSESNGAMNRVGHWKWNEGARQALLPLSYVLRIALWGLLLNKNTQKELVCAIACRVAAWAVLLRIINFEKQCNIIWWISWQFNWHGKNTFEMVRLIWTFACLGGMKNDTRGGGRVWGLCHSLWSLIFVYWFGRGFWMSPLTSLDEDLAWEAMHCFRKLRWWVITSKSTILNWQMRIVGCLQIDHSQWKTFDFFKWRTAVTQKKKEHHLGNIEIPISNLILKRSWRVESLLVCPFTLLTASGKFKQRWE